MGYAVLEPKAKQKYLNQVLDFVNEDLNALPFSEKLAWAARFFFQDEGLFAGKDVKRKSNYEEKINELSDLQGDLRNHINHLVTAEAEEVIPMAPLVRYLQIGKKDYSIQYSHAPYKDVSRIAKSDTDKLLVMLQFDEALDGLPRDTLKRCPECGKLFAHLSRKGKNYCSPKCGYKFLSRKRREELKGRPKEYAAFLKKQKEAMRKVYEKKQKERFGSNVAVRRNGKGD